jgi:hypothetical protein
MSNLPNATKEMLENIISWEKDISQYPALETILKKKFNITRSECCKDCKKFEKCDANYAGLKCTKQ